MVLKHDDILCWHAQSRSVIRIPARKHRYRLPDIAGCSGCGAAGEEMVGEGVVGVSGRGGGREEECKMRIRRADQTLAHVRSVATALHAMTPPHRRLTLYGRVPITRPTATGVHAAAPCPLAADSVLAGDTDDDSEPNTDPPQGQGWKMRVTRSTTRSLAGTTAAAAADVPVVEEKPKTAKRKATAAPKAPRKKTRSDDTSASTTPKLANTNTSVPALVPNGGAAALVPAVLTFSFEEAKRHLISVDRRFDDIFQRMKCRPFEHLETVDPFRTLAHSIMGQQISWKAARSITHRFTRLFDPSLPEKPVDHQPTAFFPTAHQVTTMDVETLRTAGLSGRKAEYVLDLASRFADGRLSTEKLLEADDEELGRMLIERSINAILNETMQWTGDLGVQRGLLRWFLSLHSPSYPLTISPKKLPQNPAEEDEDADKDANALPITINGASNGASSTQETLSGSLDVSAILPAPVLPATPVRRNNRAGKGKAKAEENSDEAEDEAMALPPPFTPSINKTLNMFASTDEFKPVPLPEGLSAAVLKSRLDGKKKIKYVFVMFAVQVLSAEMSGLVAEARS
ncbi:DNA-3-methyladenine glycosylase 1 [Grifola frondosa]|uniref:DNA-3-methyladenine glycosylase 1 n=1 Tax=Grifola frondosa TaxID=5627 RepID=A0A1C7LZ00_GRIFR|nr:DNA-3-methyladenine glycosylase 1 [Grifola frondosa]